MEVNLSDSKDSNDLIEIIEVKVGKRRRELDKPRSLKKRKEEVSILEKSLFAWFRQRMAACDPISNPLLKEIAIIMNQEIEEKTNFKNPVSANWLRSFRERYDVHVPTLGEKISDFKATEKFSEELSKEIEYWKYSLDQIYNCDEDGIYWKSMPNEKEELNDRVTFIVCANASGTHKVPLFLIGKSKSSPDWEDKELPVKYASQENAWMTSELFVHWYKNVFLPSVREFQSGKNRNDEVYLILDNARCHLSKEELEKLEYSCNVKYLPPNVSAQIQPMAQGISNKVKRLYRKNSLQEVLAKGNKEILRNYTKSKNMKTLCIQMANAWDSITQNSLRQAWQNLLPDIRFEPEISDTSQQDFLQILRQIPGYEKCSFRDVSSWLVEDDNEQGWQILDEIEIVNIIQGVEEEKAPELETVFLKDERDPLFEATEALQGLEKYRRWFENRLECELGHRVTLQKLSEVTKDIISKARIGRLKR